MSSAEAAYEEREAAWARKCDYEGWRCHMCGDTPALEDRDFFEKRMCLHCRDRYDRFMRD